MVFARQPLCKLAVVSQHSVIRPEQGSGFIDNGLGFRLVPWIPSLERELGRQVNGAAGPGGVDWSFGIASATCRSDPPISTLG
jgi:hypothetical protein